MSTAFPQPAPGTAPSPGPLTVEPGRLRSLLGITTVDFVRGREGLAVVDSPLGAAVSGAPESGAEAAPARAQADTATVAVGATSVRIDNFSFAPPTLTVPPGATVTWINSDDVPHKIVSADGRFAPSPVLDTNQRYAAGFATAGTYRYFCALHPRMTGTVVVG
jgi:plastocyanin